MKILSEHAKQRMSKRSISEIDIDYTLSMGKFFYRQQLMFFVSPDDNMVVVTTNPEVDGSMNVLTSYYRKNAIKYVKRKSKRRYKHLAA